MDEVAPDPTSLDPASARRHRSDDPEPTGAAELYIILFPGPGGHADVPDPGPPGSSGAPSLRRIGPAVQAGVRVPPAQAGRLLRVAERIVPLAVWQTSVIGSLFGAAAARLPPAGTTAVVILEIVVPPLLLRRRRREKDQ
jgi:hypothetical protein